MRSQTFTALLLAGIGLASGSTSLRLISYNIRYATTSPSAGEEPWAVRRPLMASQINFETANRPETLVCMQEVLNQQLVDLQSDLEKTWEHIGVGRNDGAQAGEYSPILYQADTWQLERNKTYWLSETPDVVGSIGWDAALPRIVTVAQFKHRTAGEPLIFMCTHFDHVGTVARKESAKLIIEIADEWKDQGTNSTKPAPVFLGGDLNIEPTNEGYQTLVAPGGFKDIKDIVPKTHWYGNTKTTSTGFTTSTSDDKRIDYLFVRDPLDNQFLTYGVLSNRFEDGVYISDHRPVVVDAKLPA
ncbi:Endonuclease/exonuclease/phosphatase [Sordaria brevicollis]|uniref:Endonuclease/exonuclease/phosphatase n=1 Tax=Sordaria brevicollis TaxID=83679 RepID=A0AAE0P314_SORBR|nr:Endonuclease/exonuclease/phosphatase [Sordaria brevicollis]